MTLPMDSIAKLNELLEAERAGVETLVRLADGVSTAEMRQLFDQVKRDEAWSCAGLAGAIKRLGGSISEKKGDFADKVMAMATLPERLELLNRGQGWVVKRLESLLQQQDLDSESRTFLATMRDIHDRNIRECEELIPRLSGKPS